MGNRNDRSELNTAWHPGELAARARAGGHDKVTALGPKLIRDHMPDQHRQFFEQLPMLIVGAEDAAGDLWTTALFGEPGFIRAPSPTRLNISMLPQPGDPLADNLQAGSQVGLLGIELETRRRNRCNGRVEARDQQQFSVAVSQSFGNCPRYITQRAPRALSLSAREHFTALPQRVIEQVAGADTLFIASAFDDGEDSRNRGVDVSHRGGEPGFVLFDAQQRLLIPDYAGNNFFNTIGNLTLDPRVGLLFVDFTGGEIVHLTGEAEVVWREAEELPFEGVARMIRVTIKKGLISHGT